MSFQLSEARIPFGVKKDTGVIVAVSEVASGSACECICPACSTPLIAKKGDHNVWHFAHESRGTFETTRDACEHSLFVSLKLMARQHYQDAKRMALPAYSLQRSGQHNKRTEEVTAARTIEFGQVDVETALEGVAVDAAISVVSSNGTVFKLGVVLTYPSHDFPVERFAEGEWRAKPVGFVEVDLQHIWACFKTHRTQFREALAALLFEQIESKRWHLHPKQFIARDRLHKAVEEEDKRIDALMSTVAQHPRPMPWSYYTPPGRANHHQSAMRHYGCKGCRVRWACLPANTLYCLQCLEAGGVTDLGVASKDAPMGLMPWV